MSVPTPHDEPATHVHVVRGAPDDLELAALVAGLVASSSASSAAHDEPAAAPAWTDRHRTLRPAPAPTPGPATWRWSLHP